MEGKVRGVSRFRDECTLMFSDEHVLILTGKRIKPVVKRMWTRVSNRGSSGIVHVRNVYVITCTYICVYICFCMCMCVCGCMYVSGHCTLKQSSNKPQLNPLHGHLNHFLHAQSPVDFVNEYLFVSRLSLVLSRQPFCLISSAKTERTRFVPGRSWWSGGWCRTREPVHGAQKWRSVSSICQNLLEAIAHYMQCRGDCIGENGECLVLLNGLLTYLECVSSERLAHGDYTLFHSTWTYSEHFM